MTEIGHPTWRGRPIPLSRQAIENEIELLIGLLDAVDDDPDLEDNADDEPWLAGSHTDIEEDRSDFEHSLGTSNPLGLRIHVPEERRQMMNGIDE